MNTPWHLLKLAAVLCLTMPVTLASRAQDPQRSTRNIIEGYPLELTRRLKSHRKKMINAGIVPTKEQMDSPANSFINKKGVVASYALWDLKKYTKIRVCFMAGGNTHLRRQIVKYANLWIRGNAKIPLDFGPNKKKPRRCKKNVLNHIRIGFKKGLGQWSLVGMKSVDPDIVSPAEISMNLEKIDTDWYSKPERKRIIIHEFGHALGLEHEHQSPFIKCGFNDLLIQEDQKWSKKRYKNNFQLLSRPGVIATRLDKKSIMFYWLKPKYFELGKKSKCYRKNPRILPSKDDLKLIAEMYHKNEKVRAKLLKQRRQRFKKLLQQSSGSKSTKRKAVDLLEFYLGDISY